MVEQILMVPGVSKIDALQMHVFIAFSWRIQHHSQTGPDSTKALLNQADRFGRNVSQYFKKLNSRFFGQGYLDHRILLWHSGCSSVTVVSVAPDHDVKLPETACHLSSDGRADRSDAALQAYNDLPWAIFPPIRQAPDERP